MSILPERSPGVFTAPFQEGFMVYDALTGTAHELNHTGGEVLLACDGTTARSELVGVWEASGHVDRQTAQRAVDAAVAYFECLGLVGRGLAWEPEIRLSGAGTDPRSDVFVGAVHRALDRSVCFRSSDRELVENIDAFVSSGRLGPARDDGELVLADVKPKVGGEIEVVFGDRFIFPTLESCLLQVTTVLNRLAAGGGPLVTLHAGGVRSPDGEIAVVAAESGGGKSTLVGTLVQAGWDYLGDEMIGVGPGGTASGYPKRIGLDDTSRALLGLGESRWIDTAVVELRDDVVCLGGEVGPIDRVLLVTYQAGADSRVEDVVGVDAFKALLANTLTFGADGDRGLKTVCELVSEVPVQWLIHGDACSAVDLISAS